MINLILGIIMMLLIIVLIFASYMYIKKKYRNQSYIRKIFMVSVLAVLLILCLRIAGIRLTPLQALKANTFVEANATFLEEIKVGENYLHIYYNPIEERYQTTYTEKVGFFYRSNSSNWYYPHEEDKVRTLGGNKVLLEEGYELVLYIVIEDPQVREIAIIDSVDNHVMSQIVKVGEPTIIHYKYPRGANISDYKAVALNDESDIIYYYGYELNDNHLSDDEYKWHVMEDGQ
ncbi:hypothetical protein AN1V17_16530 [Vallitalea sediminicola]